MTIRPRVYISEEVITAVKIPVVITTVLWLKYLAVSVAFTLTKKYGNLV